MLFILLRTSWPPAVNESINSRYVQDSDSISVTLINKTSPHDCLGQTWRLLPQLRTNHSQGLMVLTNHKPGNPPNIGQNPFYLNHRIPVHDPTCDIKDLSHEMGDSILCLSKREIPIFLVLVIMNFKMVLVLCYIIGNRRKKDGFIV